MKLPIASLFVLSLATSACGSDGNANPAAGGGAASGNHAGGSIGTSGTSSSSGGTSNTGTSGQGSGGKWFVIDAEGNAVKDETSTSAKSGY